MFTYGFFKVPLLLLNLLSVYVAFRAPNPPPQTREMEKFTTHNAGDILPISKLRTKHIHRAMVLVTSIVEIYTILLLVSPTMQQFDILFHHKMSSPRLYEINDIGITAWFLVSTCVIIATGLVRLLCYRTLGRAFTYELAVRDGHRLVTSGPYSIVRHPSYTALFLQVPATLLAQMGPGSWWYVGGMWRMTSGMIVGGFWVLLSIFYVTFFAQRGSKEDRMMRMEFGDQWDRWAERTPYKFVPYVW